MPDTATIPARNAVLTAPSLDGRTRTAKRLLALEAGFAGAIGGNLSPVQMTLVKRAARNVLLLEIDQARALAGDQAVTGFIALGTSGPTTARPTNVKPGQWHVDTTLNAAVIFDGAVWRNPATSAIA